MEKADIATCKLRPVLGLEVCFGRGDCFARSILTRWGFKKTDAMGEKSRPFDLAVHQPASVAKIMVEDFEGYHDPENLTIKPENNFCVNTYFKAGFNHEVGYEYAENDFSLLRERLAPRVENFRTDLKDEGRVCFVLRLVKPSPQKWIDAVACIESIEQRSASRDLVFVCIANEKFGAEVAAPPSEIRRKGIYLVKGSYPEQNYVWHMRNHLPPGRTFERDIARQITQALDTHLSS